MDLGLHNKRFLVGGGSAGLGRGVAEVLVGEGAEVVIVGRTADTLAEAAAAMGSAARYIQADLASPSDIDELAASLENIDGVLINGGGPQPGNAFDLSDAEWRTAFELVVNGPINLLRSLAPKLNDGSSVLFVVSSSVRQPVVGLDTSNVLRPGLSALAKSLARQLAPRTRVNAIAPGRFDTARVKMLDETVAAAQGITLEQRRHALQELIPLARYGDPIEFGRMAAFLLSPAASYVTGVTVQVDGGYISAIP